MTISFILRVAVLALYFLREVLSNEFDDQAKKRCQKSCNWFFNSCEKKNSSDEYDCVLQLWFIVALIISSLFVFLICCVCCCAFCSTGSEKQTPYNCKATKRTTRHGKKERLSPVRGNIPPETQVLPSLPFQQPSSMNISIYNSSCRDCSPPRKPFDKVLSLNRMDNKVASIQRNEMNLDTFRVNNAHDGFAKAVTSSNKNVKGKKVELTSSQRDREIAFIERNDMNLATVLVNDADDGFNKAVASTNKNLRTNMA